jgi:uracil-DNA glycosylase family 4
LSKFVHKERKEASNDLVSQITKIDGKIRRCTLCRLHEGRTNAVPGSGKINGLKLMIVGEGPGRNEDKAGEPFVGAGGKVLDSMLKKAGLKRSEVYITNIVKCRPPENRKPFDDEVETCTRHYLEKQIDLLGPKLICTLGATALEYFTDETNMAKNHGKLLNSKGGLAIFATYHPAAVFRSSSLRKVLEDDIKKIPSILKKH